MKSVRCHPGGIAVLALWVVVALLRFQGPQKPPTIAEPPGDPPGRALDGSWVVRSARFDGTEVPAAVAVAISFVFDDGWVTMKGGFAADGDRYVPVTGEQRYRFKAGLADSVGAIELVADRGDRAGGGSVPGLYKVEHGTLTLVLNFAGDRPTSLDVETTGTGRFVCERRVRVE